MNNADELIGKVFGSLEVVELGKFDERDPIYRCKCKNCGFSHIVSKTNLLSNIACPTCPSKPKQPMSDVFDLFGGFLGLDAKKKNEISTAFDKLNQPEFKDVYSSLERASVSIKNVMNGNLGSSDVARKILEVEAANLKKSFGKLIEEGQITEEEARIFKTEIDSTANLQKLKSVMEVMKQQQRAPKKAKV